MFMTWLNKITKARKNPEKSTTTSRSDYYTKDNFYKRVREREAAEKKRREKWKTEIGKMSNNNNYTYGSGIGHLPSNIASGTISTTTSIADAKITIDGVSDGTFTIDTSTMDSVGLDWIYERHSLSISEVEKMCNEYPALEKVWRNFKSVYDMVKQDYEGKKKSGEIDDDIPF